MTTENKLIVYSSLVAGSRKVNSETDMITSMLRAHKIDFDFKDISTDDEAKQQMWKNSNNDRRIPQVHRNGTFKAV